MKNSIRCLILLVFFVFCLDSLAGVRSFDELRSALDRGDDTIIIDAGVTITVPENAPSLRVKRSTNVIRGASGGAKPVLVSLNSSKPLFDIMAGADNISFDNLTLVGRLDSRQFIHAAILANNISGLIVRNSIIRDFNHGVFAYGDIDNLGNWLIENNLIENIRSKSIGLNRRLDQGAIAGSIVIRNNVIRRDARLPASRFNSESRAIAFDGGNVGLSIMDLRNTLIESNRIENLSIAFSRVKNMTIGRGNTFAANTVTFSEMIHVEELSENIRIIGNLFEPGTLNPTQSLIYLIGSNRLDVSGNSVVAAGSLARRFVTTTRYMNDLRITNNNLSGLTITHNAKQIISVQSCGANDITVTGNTWKNGLGYKAYVRLGTFFWDIFDDLIVPTRSIEDLSRIQAPDQATFNAIVFDINENLYLTCPNSDCRGLAGTVGKFNGASTASQPVDTVAVPACGPERNFFGGLPRKFNYRGWTPTF